MAEEKKKQQMQYEQEMLKMQQAMIEADMKALQAKK